MAMQHSFSSVEEQELEHLITQVFKAMPKADRAKLLLVETQLLQKAKRNGRKSLNQIPWWLVLLFAGGFAMAAWWTSELFIGEQNKNVIDKPLLPDKKNIERRSDIKEVVPNTGSDEQGDGITKESDSPVIYQRESL